MLVGFHGLEIFLPPTAAERASKAEVFWDDTWELSVLSHKEVSLFHEVLHRPFGLGAGSEGFREVEVPSVIGTPLPWANRHKSGAHHASVWPSELPLRNE